MCSSNRYIFKVAAILVVYKQAARRRYLQLSPYSPRKRFVRSTVHLVLPRIAWSVLLVNGETVCEWPVLFAHFRQTFWKKKKNRRGGDFQMRVLMDRPNEKNEFISVLVSLLQKTRSQPCLYTPCIVDEVIFLLYFS